MRTLAQLLRGMAYDAITSLGGAYYVELVMAPGPVFPVPFPARTGQGLL